MAIKVSKGECRESGFIAQAQEWAMNSTTAAEYG
jgi:hypothetical protein